ncbi:MAG: cyclic nucleotide-binding and patatin-like phospholipase domain-containing protein [Legionellaceae bacterium]|nr:cyclic nucleotide-binding and patatin-like phospholipase domain-containing protein [Legionellaceae bacterium]
MTKSTEGITRRQVSTFLSKIDLFSGLSMDVIQEMSEAFELLYVKGNTILIKQGDSSDAMYVLMFGFLRAIKNEAWGAKKVIGELGAGSVVGEIGCLFDEPRTASVYTIRDSVLLRMTRDTFDTLLEKHPRIMMGIVSQSVKRLVNPEKYSPKRDMSCFCLMPAGNYAAIESFGQAFVEQLSKYGNTLLLTYDTFKKMHGEHLNSALIENGEIFSWFQALESEYRFLVYAATEKGPWAKRCIRQADKILLVGQYGDNPALGEIEQILLTHQKETTPTTELILLFENGNKAPTETHQWLSVRRMITHYKVRQSHIKDFERLIRLITGNALGIVFSGGASYALAHVGVIRALAEANVSVDYIAGTSMGAVIGGGLAKEFDYQTMTDMLIEVLAKFQKGLDYTFPIVALLRAKVLDDLLRLSFGNETNIEDLWQKYFCVSTNIVKNKLQVHESGSLWRGVRSSISLPGILPAVLDEHQQIFVDGGILNNLPVDEMKERLQGGKVLASSIIRRNDAPSTLSYEEYTASGWHLLFKYFLLPKLNRSAEERDKNFVTIASVIQDSMIVGSNNHQESMIQQADYNVMMDLNEFSILSFSTIQEIIDSGYQQALRALETIDLSAYKTDV